MGRSMGRIYGSALWVESMGRFMACLCGSDLWVRSMGRSMGRIYGSLYGPNLWVALRLVSVGWIYGSLYGSDLWVTLWVRSMGRSMTCLCGSDLWVRSMGRSMTCLCGSALWVGFMGQTYGSLYDLSLWVGSMGRLYGSDLWVSLWVAPPGCPMASGPLLRRADDTGGEGPPHSDPPGPTAPHSDPPGPTAPHGGRSPRLTLAVLCYVNLLNYMDRFTLASVLPDVEDFFGIDDGKSGLLQTVFISSYLFLSPLFGFLGDRGSRKRLLCLASALWSGATLASSFVPRQGFWLLLLGRALVGVGEGGFSTVAPALIADVIGGPARCHALGAFYLGVPLGSGLGYIIGAKVKDVATDWRWALRVTPALGLVALALMVTLVSDPPRGGLELPPAAPLPRSRWTTDLRELATNRTLVLSSLGFTAVAFVTGALALWAPAFLQRCRVATGDLPPCHQGPRCHGDESLLFGALTCASGVLGVGLGVALSRQLRPRTPRGDPLLCGGGVLGAAPCLLLALLCARPCPPAAYVFIFLGETLLSLNWAIVADILLTVVPPWRRSTASALQIGVSHLLGDAGSPYLVGLVSDALRGAAPSPLRSAQALGRALLLCPFVAALGGGAFLGSALSLPRDRTRVLREARGLPPDDDSDGDTGDIVVPHGGRPTKVPVAHVLA
ncbi:protein spinster homolog 1 [Caloenas nicobarica]|uniref:protein spinster homolog 1 n=1 Tax=Caloenas nicobarica TaxID=187106 RepID=UPI0032B723EA